MKLKSKEINTLSHIKEQLNEHYVAWAIYGGMAAVHWGSNREISDLDIMVPDEDLERAREALMEMSPTEIKIINRKGFEFKGFEVNLPHTNVKFATDISIKTEKGEFRFKEDKHMWNRTDQIKVKNLFLPVLSCEDILLFKGIAQRGTDQNEQDLEDINNIRNKRHVEWGYVRERAHECDAYGRASQILPI